MQQYAREIKYATLQAKISKIDQQIIHNSASTQVREQNPKNDNQKKKKGTKKEGCDNDDIYHKYIYINIYIYI